MSTFFVSAAQPTPDTEGAPAAARAPEPPSAPPARRPPGRVVTLRDLNADTTGSAVWRKILVGLDKDPGGDAAVAAAAATTEAPSEDPRKRRGNRRSMSMPSVLAPEALSLDQGPVPPAGAPAPPSKRASGDVEPSQRAHVHIKVNSRDLIMDSARPDHAPRRTQLNSRNFDAARPLEDVMEGASGIIG